MLKLAVKIRKTTGKKVKKLRKKGILPAILYGPKIKEPLPLEVDYEQFEKIYQEGGESSLISLEIEGKKKKPQVLIEETERDPITSEFLHADFYQPRLEEKVEATVPLVFKGIAPAVEELDGTLVRNISEIDIKALPKRLPKEIKVNVEKLKSFDDEILVSDLQIPEGVEVLRSTKDIIALVTPPEKVEEELEKPIEEKVEEVERVEEKKEVEKVPEEKKGEETQPKN